MSKPADLGFSAPSTSDRHIKVAVYGAAGDGKTQLSLTWPNPLVVDTDGGVEAFAHRFDFKRRTNVLTTAELKNLLSRVENVTLEGDKHTLVIDTLTHFAIVAREAQRQIARKRAVKKKRDPDIEGFSPADWNALRTEWKAMMEGVKRLPCHVILICNQATKWQMDGGKMKQLGYKADAEPGLDHAVDVILRMERQGQRYAASVEKDRWHIWPVGQVLQNVTYETFAKHIAAAEGRVVPEAAPAPDSPLQPAAPARVETPPPAAQDAGGAGAPRDDPWEGVPPVVRRVVEQSKALFTRPGPTPQHKATFNKPKWLDWMSDNFAVRLGTKEQAIDTIMNMEESDRGYLLGRLAEHQAGSLWEDELAYVKTRAAEEDKLAREAEAEAKKELEGGNAG